jgi:hypothetical protein
MVVQEDLAGIIPVVKVTRARKKKVGKKRTTSGSNRSVGREAEEAVASVVRAMMIR